MSRSGLGEAWNDWYSTVLIRGMPLSESDQDSAAPEAVRRAFFDVYGYRFELCSSCRSAFDGLCQDFAHFRGDARGRERLIEERTAERLREAGQTVLATPKYREAARD